VRSTAASLFSLVASLTSSLAGCRNAADTTPTRGGPHAAALAVAGPGPSAKPAAKPTPGVQLAGGGASSMYTTYFYTAAEAVVHGYSEGTKVRIVSLSDPATGREAGTIWEGTVGVGETKLIPTGAGVFGLLSDKKAAILVGTPSSCAVVGYFVKDQDGHFRSNRFFTQLPSSAQLGGERLIVWAYDAADVIVRNPKTQQVLAEKSLPAGGRLELDRAAIAGLGNQVLEIVSTRNTVAVQVYYDQGFIVPSVEGRGTGTDFYTFAGTLTAGSNDLDLIANEQDAKVTVTDLQTGKPLFQGKIAAGKIEVLELKDQYVRVTSDRPIQVLVAAFERNGQGYAEHHFGTGREGGGIDNDFEVTTSGGLWLFSYFASNSVSVTDVRTGKPVFEGVLEAGSGHELQPGGGLYRVHAGKGLSVMGGASSCGADYSPAAGMFAVDDAMLKVIQQVAAARIQEAAARGVTLTPAAAAAAPMSPQEWDRYGAAAKASGYSRMTVDEANERAEAVKQRK
jgi:hypothetical protein